MKDAFEKILGTTKQAWAPVKSAQANSKAA